MPTEADYVDRISRAFERHQPPVDLTDDCAYLKKPTALVTTDALLDGVHFDMARDSPEQVGTQAAVANLSDLASSGGAAGWLVWSVILPKSFDVDTFEAICSGFARAAATYGARVVGGNLTVANAPLTLAVTAAGPLAGPRPLVRSAAKAGDTLYVSGRIGDAGLIFSCPKAADFAALLAARHAWRPHFAEAKVLSHFEPCHAAMDISDGLCLDASRLAKASGLVAELDSAAVPTSDLYQKHLSSPVAAMTGGEDYVLLFAASEKPPIQAWPVGQLRMCTAKEAPGALYVDGLKPTFSLGYDHFCA